MVRSHENSLEPSILLSGASGLLGTALREALGAERANVLRLVRRPPIDPGELRWQPGGRQPVTVLDGRSLTVAIHLSGANVAARRWNPAYRREMIASRVDSTAALARALAGLKKPPRVWLVASATGIYGDRGDEVLTEQSSSGAGFLADLCQRWEEAAHPAREAGIRVVWLRLGVILSRKGGALASMLPVFRMGFGGRLGDGRQWMSWISLPDAIAAVLFLMKADAIEGPVNLTSPHPVTNAEFARALGTALHRPAVLPAPSFALRLAFGQMADEALLASARVMPERLLSTRFQFSHPTLGSALQAVIRHSQHRDS